MRYGVAPHRNREGKLLKQRYLSVLSSTFVLFAVTACGGDDEESKGGNSGTPDVTVGDTVVVAVINPQVNDGHSTGTPDELSDERDAVSVKADPGEDGVTADGMVVLDVAAGSIDLVVGGAPALPLNVMAEGDVYDSPIGYSGDGSAFFDNTPIRYAVGAKSGAFFFEVADDFADIQGRLEEDDQVIVLGPGAYEGNFNITGSNVTLFGSGWSERAVTIDGSITVSGGGVRIRGLTLAGDLTANGNNFGISFSVVHGVTDIKGNAGAFLGNVFCGSAKVPSSDATLLDNYGVAPLETLPEPQAALCP
jgi:hypothetical protein